MTDFSVDLTLTDVNPEVLALLFGSPTPEPPSFSVEVAYRRAGRAGLTRTQGLIARSVHRPRWYWAMVASRPCMKTATEHRTFIPNAQLLG